MLLLPSQAGAARGISSTDEQQSDGSSQSRSVRVGPIPVRVVGINGLPVVDHPVLSFLPYRHSYADLKDTISESSGVPSEWQELVFADGTNLSDTVSDTDTNALGTALLVRALQREEQTALTLTLVVNPSRGPSLPAHEWTNRYNAWHNDFWQELRWGGGETWWSGMGERELIDRWYDRHGCNELRAPGNYPPAFQ